MRIRPETALSPLDQYEALLKDITMRMFLFLRGRDGYTNIPLIDLKHFNQLTRTASGNDAKNAKVVDAEPAAAD